MSTKKVYLAGSCFSAAERQWNVAVKSALEIVCPSEFEFYLPQEHVEEYWAATTIYTELVSGLIQSRVIVANLDGSSGDDGTCWEMGFIAGMNEVAKGLGATNPKQIFWYRTDFRRGGDCEHNVNLMMAYGGTPITLSGVTPAEVAKSIGRVLIK